jgi:hypothetical protein
MKKLSLITCAGAALSAAVMLFSTPAMAGPHVDVGINIGIPGFYAPAPVYVRPERIYVEPRPVYVQPRPYYVQPAPYYMEQRDDDYREQWRERRHGHHDRHHDDED